MTELEEQINELRESMKALTGRVSVLESLSAEDISPATAKAMQAQLTEGL
jgi:hypothetical protein